MVKPYVKGIIRESPPKAHAKGRKGGQKVIIVRESPPKEYKGWAKGGQARKYNNQILPANRAADSTASFVVVGP